MRRNEFSMKPTITAAWPAVLVIFLVCSFAIGEGADSGTPVHDAEAIDDADVDRMRIAADALSAEQLSLKEELLSEARSSAFRSEAFERVVKLFYDRENAEVARSILYEIASEEDSGNAVRAISLLGSRPDEEVKFLLVDIVKNRNNHSMVRTAAGALRNQNLSDEEVRSLMQTAGGLDQRVNEGRAMHGPQLEGHLLTSLAASAGQKILPDLLEYLDSPDATPGLVDQRPAILGAVDSDEARQLLLHELMGLDLTSNTGTVSRVSALAGSLSRGLRSEVPPSRSLEVVSKPQETD